MKNIPSCLDIDECRTWRICPDNSVCQNSAGDYSCQCHAGFQGNLCTDIDECSITTICHSNAKCKNSEGSYKCSCIVGFHGNGKTCREGKCDDRQCLTGQKCISPTSDQCGCQKGLRLVIRCAFFSNFFSARSNFLLRITIRITFHWFSDPG